jgi:hypothetical protein
MAEDGRDTSIAAPGSARKHYDNPLRKTISGVIERQMNRRMGLTGPDGIWDDRADIEAAIRLRDEGVTK